MTTTKDPNKKYVVLENILTNINARAIAMQEKEIKRNNTILQTVIDKLILKMRQKDPLFNNLCKRTFYGGSFYDNLKVGNPNEFDLDLILTLPDICVPCVRCSEQPGFVKVEIKEYYKILERPEPERVKYEKINKLLDQSNFLSTNEVLKWMEGLTNKALNDMPKDEFGNTYSDLDKTKIYIKLSKGAPAFTLKLSGNDVDGNKIQLDIDLVPCFLFTKTNWPDKSGGYRPNPVTSKETFFVVPKKPKEENLANSLVVERYWRLSFQEQERELIKGQEKKCLKSSLKLIKKLRDKHNHKIASYFIKTVYLWAVEKEPASFWCQPLSVVFMTMLSKYAEFMRSKNIPYYWNDKYNLIGYLKDSTKSDIANTLQNIIDKVNKSLDDPLSDPYVIGQFFLSKEEYEKLKTEVKLGKKQEKQLQFAFSNNILNSPSIDTPDSSVSIPPITRLGFDAEVVDRMMAQLNGVTSKLSNSGDTVNYLRRIDQKMDKMLEKFDKIIEANANTNLRVSTLEDKFKQLEIENRNLRHRLGEASSSEVNSVDALLNIRQIQSPFATDIHPAFLN